MCVPLCNGRGAAQGQTSTWARGFVRAAFSSPVGGCVGGCGLQLASGWVRGCMHAWMRACGLQFASGCVGGCVRPLARQVGGCKGACVQPSARQVGAWVRSAVGSPVDGCMEAFSLRLASGWVHGCVQPLARQWVRGWVRAAFGSPVVAWVGAC
jgi:hypothetical protein